MSLKTEVRRTTLTLLAAFFLVTLSANVQAQDAASQAANPTASAIDSDGQATEPALNTPEQTDESDAAEASDAAPTALSDAELSSGGLPAHNAWMLVSCALVLFMTAPGLAMFYGGLVRKKNVLSVVMQCVFLMGLMTCLWAIYGYSLAFGGSNPYIGNFDYLFMNGVARYWDDATNQALTPMATDLPIPLLTHMLFQGMFFIITPALICGAFAERMKFSAMVVFSILWGTFVYCPLCHWVWGGGILAFGEDHAILGGALDFAGGTVVHISSGVTALIAAILIGPRIGHGKEPMPPHNLTYTALGAAMLWVGWFGFNAGSEFMVDGITSSAFAVTHFAAAAGAVAWACTEWLQRGKPTLLGASSGAVAGLVCITPGAGFVNLMPALIMGAVCWCGVLPGLLSDQGGFQIRRFTGCVWRSWRWWNPRCSTDRRVCNSCHLGYRRRESTGPN